MIRRIFSLARRPGPGVAALLPGAEPQLHGPWHGMARTYNLGDDLLRGGVSELEHTPLTAFLLSCGARSCSVTRPHFGLGG